jgi:hypothetical protein
VLRIHEILGRIRIRGSIPMDTDPDSDPDLDPVIFISDLQGVNNKLLVFCLLLFEGTFTSFFKDKKS